ncbi:MAG: xanthine dehydrogenase family protein subunit M [Calditrichaeota bacterium]|nr:xanthine dehydrogenase family protein subunit M [Calditrichota bacterium]
MKPAAFDYHAPESLEEALALLNEYGYEAKLLAGGQSLIPTMNFRLARPAVLIDLNRIKELSYIEKNGSGLRLGAMTRQRALERSELVANHAPLLHETMPFIAHPQIRNRGTIGGNIAHADPASELPAVMWALDGYLKLQSAAGERRVAVQDFFVGMFTTDLEPEEMLTEIEIPAMFPSSGWAFREIARRHGDYALVGVAATVRLDEAGRCEDARLVFLSVGEGPVEAQLASDALIGELPGDALIETAAALAAEADIDPDGDIHASADYRRQLARVLARDTLRRAFERAK